MEQDRDTLEAPIDATRSVDWADSEYLVMNDFQDLATKRIELKLEQDQIAKKIEELNLELLGMLRTAELTNVKFGYYRVFMGCGTLGGRLSRERLLEAGVSEAQLKRGTIPKSPGKPFIRVEEIRGAPED